jgi:HdeA/HdeB family
MIARTLATLTLASALLAAAPATAAPPAPSTIDIAKVTCSDLIKANELDRAAVVMFYWGYAAAKAGVTTFKTGVLQAATQHLMSACAKNPSETMFDAMHDTDIKAF